MDEGGGFQRAGRRKLREGEAEQRKNLSVALRLVLPRNPTPTTRLDYVFSKARIEYCSTVHSSTAHALQDTEQMLRTCLINAESNYFLIFGVPGGKLPDRRASIYSDPVSDTLLICTVAKNKTVFT